MLKNINLIEILYNLQDNTKQYTKIWCMIKITSLYERIGSTRLKDWIICLICKTVVMVIFRNFGNMTFTNDTGNSTVLIFFEKFFPRRFHVSSLEYCIMKVRIEVHDPVKCIKNKVK